MVEDSDVREERDRVVDSSPDQLANGNALVLNQLSKFYGGFLAVDKLTISIPQGECFGLLGVNGAGKTSTFKMLTGDETISGGSVYVRGHDVSKNIKVAQQFLGYCPQFDALIDQMTVEETLYMYARLAWGVQSVCCASRVESHPETHAHQVHRQVGGKPEVSLHIRRFDYTYWYNKMTLYSYTPMMNVQCLVETLRPRAWWLKTTKTDESFVTRENNAVNVNG